MANLHFRSEAEIPSDLLAVLVRIETYDYEGEDQWGATITWKGQEWTVTGCAVPAPRIDITIQPAG